MININGIEYNKVQTGYHIRESLTNELDSCFVVLHLNEKPNIKLYDVVEFDNRKWFVSIINFVRKKEGYQVNLTLSELTLILEKYILSPCSFTNPNDTLKEQVEKLFYKVEPIRVGETPRFKLEQELSDILASKPGEDFIYPERMTLREILDDMISSLGYRAEVVDLNSDLSQIIIGYRDLNKRSSDIKSLTKITAEEEMESAEYYANEFNIDVRNVQSRRKSEIVHDWQTMKPVEIENVNDKNIKLVVDYPIEQITKVLVNFEREVQYKEFGEGQIKKENINFLFDITDLFLENEIYKTLDIVQQQNFIPYIRGSNIIGATDTYKLIFFTYSKLNNYLSPLAYNKAIQFIENKHKIEVETIQLTLPNVADGMLFKVHYIPYLDMQFKQSKDLNAINKKIGTISNQIDRTIELEKFSKSIRTLANITGNKEMTVDFIANGKYDMLELGDRIENDYIIVSREYFVFNNFVKGRYTLVHRYEGNISARLSRERRLYSIPKENLVERNLIIKDNLLISTSPITIFNDSSLKNETLEVIVKSFSGNIVSDYIDKILFQTRDINNNTYPSLNSYFTLNFSGKAVGKSLIWKMKTQDNYSVGLSTEKRIWLGKDVLLNPYCDSNGECERIDFSFIKSDMEALDYEDRLKVGKSLPVINVANYPKYLKERLSNTTIGYAYTIKKDRLEILNLVYQLEAKQLDNVIVGNYLTEFLGLLWNRNISELKIWISKDALYNHNDLNACKGEILTSPYSIIAIPGPVNYQITLNYNVSQVKSWAIGTIDGKLLLAVNNNNLPLNQIYFGFTRNK